MNIYILGVRERCYNNIRELFDSHDYNVTILKSSENINQSILMCEQGLLIVDGARKLAEGLRLKSMTLRSVGVGIIVIAPPIDPLTPIIALELGADDVLVTPFSHRELLARARAVMRRRTPKQLPARPLRVKGWALRQEGRELQTPRGRRHILTSQEFKIACLFLSSPEKLFTRDDISAALHSSGYKPHVRSVDVQISRLRTKLGSEGRDFIRTVRHGGYRFLSNVGDAFRSSDPVRGAPRHDTGACA